MFADRRKRDFLLFTFDIIENGLSQGRENPLTYSARGAKSQPQISHSADLGNYQASVATGKV